MTIKLPALVGVLLVSSCISTSSLAIDFSLSRWPVLDIIGEIRVGDGELLAKMLANSTPRAIAISSPGGDVREAIRMAALVKGTHVPLIVKGEGGFCASSCFFLFLAADTRMALISDEDGRLRSDWKSGNLGPLGIHRPYVKFDDQNTNLSIEKQEQVVRDAEVYLKEQRLPQHLIDEMLSRPSNDIYWLSSKDIDLIGEYSAGYSEALVAKCNYMTTMRLAEKNWPSVQNDAYIDRFSDCQQALWERERFPLAKQFYKKLKSGWRPWKK